MSTLDTAVPAGAVARETSEFDMARLRALAMSATPGPWRECGTRDGCGLVWSGPADAPIATTDTDSEEFTSTRERKLADAAYIAAAGPSTVLALLDRLAVLGAAVQMAIDFETRPSSDFDAAYPGAWDPTTDKATGYIAALRLAAASAEGGPS